MIDAGDPWETFEHSAFHLETLPEYRMPKEAGRMERYLAGLPMPDNYNAEWHEKIRCYAAGSRIVQRVRVVQLPLTDYQRRQFDWAYPGNLQVGEDTRILDHDAADALGLPDWDFWFFDDVLVRRQDYEPDGTFSGAPS